MTIALSDEEKELVLSLARPIEPERQRAAFLAAVAAEVEASGQSGVSLVHRVARETQKRFYSPPEFPNLTAPLHRGARTA
jgi:hypothetical protein